MPRNIKTSTEFKQRRISLRLTQREVARLLNCSAMGVCFAGRGLRTTGRVAREMARLLLALEEGAR